MLGHTIAKRYRIIKLLGYGGMGSVYQAEDTRLEILVALKLLKEYSTEAREQFELEAKILAKLNHPHLPRVSDYFNYNGDDYIIMDFVSGEDLQSLLMKRNKPFDADKIIAWMIDILDALDYIHNNQIIHRDIKPANIKITIEGKVILVDFGIAKIGLRLATAIGAHNAYTPHFAPPEQCQANSRTGIYSDIYMIGSTMYYLLTGQLPPEALVRLNGMPLLPPSHFNNKLSVEISNIIMKSLQLKPQNRFSSAKNMQKALKDLINISITNNTISGITPAPKSTGFVRDLRRG